MKMMLKRYNCKQLVPTVSKVKLPYSKAVVSVPIQQAQDCIVSLLTDPRAKDADYLFWYDDPLAAPPETVVWLADLNLIIRTQKCIGMFQRGCLRRSCDPKNVVA